MEVQVSKKLSIIVPVYNVEQYVRQCLESIFRQGLDERDFEVIMVNDGTEDDSFGRIADIVRQHTNISIVEQANQGLSVARNTGLAMARGEYVLMPDPDDLLVTDSLAPLLERATTKKADLLVADFIEVKEKDAVTADAVCEETTNPDPQDALFLEKTGRELFMEDLVAEECYVWRTLFRRSFLLEHGISFVPGIRYQDVPFTHECYLRAGRCIRAHWLLNIYRRQRPGAATASFDAKKAHDFCIAIGHTWQLRKMEGLDARCRRKLYQDVYTSFSSLVYATLYGIKDRRERLGVLRFLLAQAPGLSFCGSTKQRAESLLLRLMPALYLRVREWHLRLK